MPAFLRPSRIMLAVEMPDGSAQIWEIQSPTVNISTIEYSVDFLTPLITMTAQGYFAKTYFRPASDFFDDQPEIAPPTKALNP